MIAFGCSITKGDVYDRCAAPGIRRVAEEDSEILAYGSIGSIFRSYNMLLDLASELDDLEALVLVHQDAEIVDPDFCAKVRHGLSDPDVALVGCAGAIGVRSIAWWEGAVTWASFTHRYEELGGGEIPALTWKREETPSYAKLGEVDSVDGFAMALSPWAVRELRFDESLGRFHGYDFDYCMQARAAGKKIVLEDLKLVHHHSLELISELESWIEAHIRLSEKWDGRVPYVGSGAGSWKERARRAEAEASAARTQSAAADLLNQALLKQITEIEHSFSWRLTTPLRWIKRLLRRGGDRSTKPATEGSDGVVAIR